MILNMDLFRSLCQLRPGQTATIATVGAEDRIRERMAALGLRRGRLISVIRHARMNGPIQIRIGTTDIILRRSEAATIQVGPAATT